MVSVHGMGSNRALQGIPNHFDFPYDSAVCFWRLSFSVSDQHGTGYNLSFVPCTMHNTLDLHEDPFLYDLWIGTA